MSLHELSHLLILTPGFPENEEDTTCLPAVQQFVLCYTRKFPAIKVNIIALQYPAQKGNYRWNGIDVYSAGGKNRTGIIRGTAILNALLKAVGINKRQKIDAVLSLWLTDAALAGKTITKLLRKPHFIWMHGQDARRGNRYFKLIKPESKNLAVLSDYHNEVLYNNYGIKGHVVNNGINEMAFPDFNSGARTIDLLAAGSLIPLKQYHLFIELIKFLVDNGYKNIRAVLVGEGTLRKDLASLIHQYQLESNITLTGKMSHKQVLDLMNNAKIFVHTSNYESQSTVVLEALYSGCKTFSFLPIGYKNLNSFKYCTDFSEMKGHVINMLNDELSFKREMCNDMEDSAVLLNSILNSLVNDFYR